MTDFDLKDGVTAKYRADKHVIEYRRAKEREVFAEFDIESGRHFCHGNAEEALSYDGVICSILSRFLNEVLNGEGVKNCCKYVIEDWED